MYQRTTTHSFRMLRVKDASAMNDCLSRMLTGLLPTGGLSDGSRKSERSGDVEVKILSRVGLQFEDYAGGRIRGGGALTKRTSRRYTGSSFSPATKSFRVSASFPSVTARGKIIRPAGNQR